MESLVGGDAENVEKQRRRFGRDENVAGGVEVQYRDDLALGVLRGADLLPRPQSLWHPPLLDLGEKYLGRRHVVAILAPPDTTVLIQLSEAFLRHAPIGASGWPVDHAPTGAGYGVQPLAVSIPRRQVVGPPRASRIVVGVLVDSVLLLRSRKRIGLPHFLVSGIDKNEVVIVGEVLGRTLGRIDLLPDRRGNEVLLPKHLVHQAPQSVYFVVVNRHEDRAVVAQQLPQQLQPRQHHAAPLVVARQVVPIHHLAEPVLHHRRVHAVVVRPAFVAGVVRRIDVDALHLPMIRRQQRLQPRQIVPMHNQVVVQTHRLG